MHIKNKTMKTHGARRREPPRQTAGHETNLCPFMERCHSKRSPYLGLDTRNDEAAANFSE
jgi:hypothetical protein